MLEFFTFPPIEAVIVVLISSVLFIPAFCVVKMVEEMIKITTGGYSNNPHNQKKTGN